MDIINVSNHNDITTVTLVRGKVHALNEASLDRLLGCLDEMRGDPGTRVVVLTGEGSFFSFGLDVPEIYDYSEHDCAHFLGKFTRLYSELYVFPKPVIAAINGHAIAGGCMLSNACDYRVMVTGKARISLNEVTFGSSIFAGSAEVLRNLVGPRNAELIATTGSMFSAEDAAALGLIDLAVAPDALASNVINATEHYKGIDLRAFAAIKRLMRRPIFEQMQRREQQSIQHFIDLWYSPETREKLKGIQIK